MHCKENKSITITLTSQEAYEAFDMYIRKRLSVFEGRMEGSTVRNINMDNESGNATVYYAPDPKEFF